MTNKKLFPRCRFCRASNKKQRLKGINVYGGKKNQHFYQCEECQIIYLHPILNKSKEKLLYEKNFEKFMSKRSGKDVNWNIPIEHVKSNKKEAKRRLIFLKPLLKKKIKILEIGCSSGFMLYELKKYGHDVYGLDPSGKFLEFVKFNKIVCFNNYNEILKYNIKFDLIIHYYVLEHIASPYKFLHDYFKLLKSNGNMIFEIPNSSEPLIELYKNKSFENFYWSVVHHWYFNNFSLNQLLRKFKYTYKIYPEQRYDLSNHIHWMNKGQPGGYGKYDNIFTKNFNNMYKNILRRNWFCDTLIASIKKNK